MSRKKRIRIFHPRKLWVTLATISLTLGMAVGEGHFSANQVDPRVAPKMNRNVQTSTFNFFESAKQGVRRGNYQVSLLTSKDANPLEAHDEPTKSGVKSVCFWEDVLEEGEEEMFKAEMVEVKISEAIEPGEEFRVEIYLKNTGNTTWFGANSRCSDQNYVNLGTEKTRDRESIFFYEGENTGWIGNNRLEMLDDVIHPEETGSFVFTSVAPTDHEGNIYREYFSLVKENVSWLDGFEIPLDIPVGEVTEEDEYRVQFIRDLSLDTRSLTGEPFIEVNLSTQQMFLKFGDQAVYTMPVSTGAANTPTPTGTWNILNQQDLRIGGASPHYRMPQWQGFTVWGHGLHALPYLASDNGVFWSEALDHIGIPVSHGCIRLLPDDALVVYEFGEIGMELYIHY